MKKTIALLLCACLMLGLLSGCGGDDGYVPTGNGLADVTQPEGTEVTAPGGLQEEQEIYTLAYYAADGFNPYTCTNFTNRMLFSLMYQGLFAVDREYQVEPMLCKSFTVTSDLCTYTFRLENATFSDGSTITAADVTASLNAAKENEYYEGRFDLISDISALDEKTVRITTYYSYENLPMILDIPIVKADQVTVDMPVGTGPYVLKNTAGGLSLQKRTDWWCSADVPITTTTIPLTAFTDPAKIRDCFEFENLGISIADPGASSYAEYRCDYELWEMETGIFLYLGCNIYGSVFSNAEVRETLKYAIDRSRILEECYNGFGAAATLPASPNSPFYSTGLANSVEYDPARFEQAVADAGMIGKEIILYVNKSDSVRLKTARIIAETLTECGLVVTIETNSTAYFISGLNQGGYDLYLGQTKLSASMDLTQFFSPYGELSYGGMSHAACYSLAKESLENSGNFYNLHKMVIEEGQLVPVLFRTYAIYAKRGLLDSLSPARDNVFYYSLGKDLEEAKTIEYLDD